MKQSNLAAGEERVGLGRVETVCNIYWKVYMYILHPIVPARVNVLLIKMVVVAKHWTTVPPSVSDAVTVSSDIKSPKLPFCTTMVSLALNCPLSSIAVIPTAALTGNRIGLLILIYGTAIQIRVTPSVTMQVKVTTFPGQVVPTSSTLEVRDTVWAEVEPDKIQSKKQ